MAIKTRNKVSEYSAGNAGGVALVASGTGAATILTGGVFLVDPNEVIGYGGNLMSVQVHNTNTSTSRRCAGFLVPSGETRADKHKIFDEVVPANGMMLYQPRRPRKYKGAATVQVWQDTGTDCLGWAEAIENYQG